MKFVLPRFLSSRSTDKLRISENYLHKIKRNLKYFSSKSRMSISSSTVSDKNKAPSQKTEKMGTLPINFIKSENDSMEYRIIELKNGLRAILVSDVLNLVDIEALNEPLTEDDSSEDDMSQLMPCTIDDDEEQCYSQLEEDEEDDRKSPIKEGKEKMAACALCIGVGSFSDPPDIPGLAHFLEHMVFMGSSKYPQENGFDEFIKKHGGSDNASTECETTSFYLECSEKYLREGMDRFAQFFISPLLKREAMTREREIIHSEFEMCLPSDGSRREQVLASLAPNDHPAGKFQWGNLITLAENVEDDVLYERVHAFRQRHYSANRMTVAVQARLPLDLLEEYVRETFSDIPNNEQPPEDFSKFVDLYGNPELFNKIVWIKPVKDICQVNLTWVLPSYMKEYKSKPLDHVGWLVGQEGKGSLLSYLRKKVWALECQAGNDESGFEHNSIFSLFSILLVLTEEGYKHLNEVVASVFSYIKMLKKSCPDKTIYNELQKIADTNFRFDGVTLNRFKMEIPAAENVEILAESMQLYEPEHYLAGGELYLQYKPRIVTEILDLLTPDRVNVIIYSKDNPDSFYDKVEPWFQTKHKIEGISPQWKGSWVLSPTIEDFHMPEPNPYLTTDFSLLPEPAINPPYPEKILDNQLQELWYRQDVKFRKPLAHFAFYIMSPKLKAHPMNSVLLDLLIGFIEMKLTEQTFTANHAGLFCVFYLIDLGLSIQCSGYNEKLPLYFDEVLKKLYQYCREINDESNLEIFNAILKGRIRLYYNKFLKPKKLAKMLRLSLLTDCYWTAVETLELLKQVTPEKLQKFALEFFNEVRILGLIQGNISKEKSLELCEKFDTELHCTPLLEERPQARVTKLSNGEKFLRIKSFIEEDSNSVIVNYYQVGQGLRTSCLIDLLTMLMDEPLFDSLRTKQQIGYDINCLLRDTFGILGFTVTVFFQSNKFSPDEVDFKIEEFLQYFLKKLRSMSKSEFEEAKASLVLLKSSADLHLHDEVKRNFAEISTGEYIFDRIQKEVQMIPEISHKELCQFLAEHTVSGKNFRKLSIQVVGVVTPENSVSENEENAAKEKTYKLTPLPCPEEKRYFCISDIESFRNEREFYPLREKS